MMPMAKKKTKKRAVAKASRVPAKKRPKAASKRPVKKSAASKPAPRKASKAAKKPAKAAAKKPMSTAPKKPAKSVAAKKPVAAKPARVKVGKPDGNSRRRRDGSGHLDPHYAADLRRQSGRPEAEGVGFVGGAHSNDDLAEALGEQFVEAATTGEDAAEEMLDQEVTEERGGPFVRSNAGIEFADGTDGSNPKGSKREPFPTT
jgi:hypothetical protein